MVRCQFNVETSGHRPTCTRYSTSKNADVRPFFTSSLETRWWFFSWALTISLRVILYRFFKPSCKAIRTTNELLINYWSDDLRQLMTLVTHLGQHSMRWYWPITLLYKPNSPNYGRHSSTLSSSVAQSPQCPSIFLSAEVSPRHLGTDAEMSGQFGTGVCAEMSWVRSVLGPKCLDTYTHAPNTGGRHIISVYISPVKLAENTIQTLTHTI